MFIKSDKIDTDIVIPPPRLLSSGRKLVTDEQRSLMVDLYEKGYSTWKIGEAFGYLNVCIINNLRKADVKMRNRSDANKTISVNRHYFDHIDSPTKAYILGYIYADGNISKDSFTIALQERDKYILEAMANEIGYTGELSFRNKQTPNKQNMWALRVHDKVFAESLRKLGIVERKTSNLEFPKFLDPSLRYAFIHGLSDGDGCICSNKTRILYTLAGSKTMVLDVKAILCDDLGLDLAYRDTPGSKGKTGTLCGSNAMKFLHKMYLESRSTIYLNRKLDKFLTYLRYKEIKSSTYKHTSKFIPSSFYINILKDLS